MEELILLLVMCAVAVGIFYACVSYSRNRKTPEPPLVVELEPATPPQQPVLVSLDSQTEDEKYAQIHHMWVCEYCETLNPIPEGATIKKTTTHSEPTTALSGLGSLLRGDLARAKGEAHKSSKALSNELICVACGKSQHSITI